MHGDSYLTSSQRSRYLMSIDNEGKFRWDDPEPRYAEIEKHPLVDSTPGAFVDTMGDGILPRYLAGEQETEDHARTKTDDRVPEPKAEAARIGNQVNGQPNGQEQGPKMRKYKSLGEPKEAKDIFIYVSDLHCKPLTDESMVTRAYVMRRQTTCTAASSTRGASSIRRCCRAVPLPRPAFSK